MIVRLVVTRAKAGPMSAFRAMHRRLKGPRSRAAVSALKMLRTAPTLRPSSRTTLLRTKRSLAAVLRACGLPTLLRACSLATVLRAGGLATLLWTCPWAVGVAIIRGRVGSRVMRRTILRPVVALFGPGLIILARVVASLFILVTVSLRQSRRRAD